MMDLAIMMMYSTKFGNNLYTFLHYHGNAFFQGGSQNWALAGPSLRDIQRVAELYPRRPLDSINSGHRQERDVPEPRTYQVIIPDFVTTTIQSAPTGPLKAVSDPEVQDGFKKYPRPPSGWEGPIG